jgi:hypothetical protein
VCVAGGGGGHKYEGVACLVSSPVKPMPDVVRATVRVEGGQGWCQGQGC